MLANSEPTGSKPVADIRPVGQASRMKGTTTNERVYTVTDYWDGPRGTPAATFVNFR